LTSADQSPLTHSVVQEPSASLASDIFTQIIFLKTAQTKVNITRYKINLTASTVQCTVWKTIFIGDLVTSNNQFGFKKQLSSSHAAPILHLPISKLNKSASRAPVVSYITLSFLPSANSAGVKTTPVNFNDEKLFTM